MVYNRSECKSEGRRGGGGEREREREREAGGCQAAETLTDEVAE